MLQRSLAIVLGALCAIAASGAPAGEPPKESARKLPPYTVDDTCVAYQQSFRLTFSPFKANELPATCGWRGDNRYRIVQRPDQNQKDRSLGFLGGRSGSNTTLHFQAETIGYDLSGDGKYVGSSEIYNRNNRDMSWGPIHMRLKHASPDAAETPYAVILWRKYSNGDIENKPNYRPPEKVSAQDYVACRAGCMKGTVLGSNVELYDDNTNGRYNEVGVDSISVDGRCLPLASTISLDGAIYFIKVAPSGSVVLLGEMAGPFGTLKPYASFQATPGLEVSGLFLVGANGTFEVSRTKAKEGIVQVPPEAYQVSEAFISGQGTLLRLCTTGEFKVEIAEGKVVPLPEWGPPYKLIATVDSGPTGIDIADVCLKGKAGESYFILDGEPTVTIAAGRTPVFEKKMSRNDRGDLARLRHDPQRTGTYFVTVTYQTPAVRAIRSEAYKVEFKGTGG